MFKKSDEKTHMIKSIIGCITGRNEDFLLRLSRFAKEPRMKYVKHI